jgi:hypothetical protein
MHVRQARTSNLKTPRSSLQYYMSQHLAREFHGKQLNTEAGYYVYNYDTAVWAASAVLAKLTDLPQYHTQIRSFLRTWVELKPPKVSPDVVSACSGKLPRGAFEIVLLESRE